MIKRLSISLILIFTLFLSPLLAQRAEMERVKIRLKSLPSMPLEQEVKTYNYRIFNTTSLTLPSPETINGYLRMEGFEFASTSPDVILLVNLDGYEEKFSVATIKDISTPKYVYRISAKIDVQLRFLSGDSRFEYYQTSRLLTEDDTRYSYQSTQTYATEMEASDAGKKDEFMYKEAKVQTLNKVLFSIQQYLKRYHTYPVEDAGIPVYSIKAKSFDYSDMDIAQEKAIAALKLFSENGLTTESRALFNEVVLLWEKSLTEFNETDKKARINPKNVGTLYANLALTYCWLDNNQKANEYLDKLKKSRSASAAGFIGEIVNPYIAGREADVKRKNGTLAIAKTKSALYVSSDFLMNKHSHRIVAIQKNNFLNKKLPDQRRHFEYSESGLLIKVSTEFYNAGTKLWERPKEIHSIQYDHDRSIMYTFDAKSTTIPLTVKRFQNGKLVYQKSRVGDNDSTVLKFFYLPNGLLDRYVVNAHNKSQNSEVRYSYTNEVMTKKEVFESKDGNLISRFKDEFIWADKKLIKIKSYGSSENGTYGTEPLEEIFNYNTNGFLVGKSSRYELETFGIDEFGNITEINAKRDDGSETWYYVWEKGAGNSSQYHNVLSDRLGPEKFPALY
jgi:hypothetical protein